MITYKIADIIKKLVLYTGRVSKKLPTHLASLRPKEQIECSNPVYRPKYYCQFSGVKTVQQEYAEVTYYFGPIKTNNKDFYLIRWKY